ncbi:MAG: ATP-binding protein, partial [Candidatus Acidiferrum sp.]
MLVLIGAIEIAVLAAVSDGELRGRLAGLVAACGGLAIAAALALSVHFARDINRPILAVIRAANQSGIEHEAQRVVIADTDELAALGQSFNGMSTRLNGRIAELEDDRHQLRAILSGMVEGVVALDSEQRILFVNARAVSLIELPDPLPVGRRFWEVVRQRPLLDVVRKALDQAEPSRAEITWAGNPGRLLTVHAARLAGPLPRGAVLVLHDTSELRRLERLRQDFVANVSHELKTPLSVIKACVETLLDGAAEDSGARGLFLRRIAEQSDRLYLLILDLLSLARIESETELFEFKAVPVAPVVRTCLERHRTRAQGRHQSLVFAGPQESNGAALDLAVWADEEAFDQILDNLIDNAVKYTPDGGEINVLWRAEEGQVCLDISDNGIGIPEIDLPRIFERFYR